MSCPKVTGKSTSISPDVSLPMPSSSAPQHIPKLSYPASFALLIFCPQTLAPICARQTIIPSLTFGAPHIICTVSVPLNTCSLCSFVDSGIDSTFLILAKTTPEIFSPLCSTPSISAVVKLNLLISSFSSIPSRLTNSFIQLRDTFILSPLHLCSKLF